ncbi:phospholipase D-like protein [Bacillus sp. V-88]|nr:hypothetical protein B1B00_16880 [Bacillus sp. DSM 27956]PRX72851.1 phospholipase D-like protein [Bacillus sp. V-88]SLK24202.1 PLD-like domain-containing protein [Bacillus sp. V-88]
MSEIIFTRPGTKCDIKEKLIKDIENTKFRIYMAMFSFTDRDIYDAMHRSCAPNALFILNEGDIKGENKSRSNDLVNKYNIHTVILGNNKFSKMHHKFIILDNVAYIGSYNFSYPASNQNWEFVMKITDQEDVKKIEEEFWGMWFIGGARILNGNKCFNCNSQIEELYDHFTIMVDYKSFSTINDPREYIKTSCISLTDNCSVCKAITAKVKINYGENYQIYCIKCAGDVLNKKFINNQMGWESENIYYEELAIWSSETPGEDVYGECGICKQIKALVLLNEISRGQKTQDNPYGILIGEEKNICEDCYNKDFSSAYIINQL